MCPNHLLIRALYQSLFTHLLIYFLKNKPFHFNKKRPYLANFLFYFVLLYILLQTHVCVCCVRFSFSVLSHEMLGRTAPKWPILCWVKHKTLTQSIQPTAVAPIAPEKSVPVVLTALVCQLVTCWWWVAVVRCLLADRSLERSTRVRVTVQSIGGVNVWCVKSGLLRRRIDEYFSRSWRQHTRWC